MTAINKNGRTAAAATAPVTVKSECHGAAALQLCWNSSPGFLLCFDEPSSCWPPLFHCPAIAGGSCPSVHPADVSPTRPAIASIAGADSDDSSGTITQTIRLSVLKPSAGAPPCRL